MEQVFALEPDARAAKGFREPPCIIERCWTPSIMVQQLCEFPLKFRVLARGQVCGLQLLDGSHQYFGDVAAAVRPEVTTGIGLRIHAASALRAACRNSVIFLRSFFPGALSMREHASTPIGRITCTA